jgi:hypothetical protein
MFTRPSIVVTLPRIKGSQVTCRFTCSRRLRRFFTTFTLEIAYDVAVTDVPPSILTIPIVASLVPVAWAAGADLHVETLDATFRDCLTPVRAAFRTMYPKLIRPSRLVVDRPVANRHRKKGYGLLFSGGVDSTASFYKNLARRPNLITVDGVDPPWLVQRDWGVTRAAFWTRLKRTYGAFAAAEGVAINFIQTNARGFLDEARLNRHFGYFLTSGHWWIGIQHGLSLLGLCAPLTVLKGLGTLLISSAGESDVAAHARPNASRPWISEKVAWSDVTVSTEGYPLTRQEKIRRYLKPYLAGGAHHPTLRVCWSRYNALNCSDCEKCHRTIGGLLLENIDPNTVGFRIGAGYVQRLQQDLQAHPDRHLPSAWRQIQALIPDDLSHNLHDSCAFFEWLRTHEFPSTPKTTHPLIRYTPIVVRRYLPEAIKNLIRSTILRES